MFQNNNILYDNYFGLVIYFIIKKQITKIIFKK